MLQSLLSKNYNGAHASRKLRSIVSHQSKISRKSDSRRYTQPAKLKRWPKILVKLRIREMCSSKSFGFQTFPIITISFSLKE